MKDIQTITIVDDLTITTATQVADSPRTLLLYAEGGGLSTTQRVSINDLGVDAFRILNDRQVTVVVPEQLVDTSLASMTFLVLSSVASGLRRVRLIHELTLRPRAVTGRQKLIQHVVRVLLSTARSNRFDPSSGGNLADLMGRVASDSGDVAVAAAQATQATEAYIKTRQRGLRLPPDGRLRALQFQGVTIDRGEAVAVLALEDYAGGTLNLPVVL